MKKNENVDFTENRTIENIKSKILPIEIPIWHIIFEPLIELLLKIFCRIKCCK